MTHRALHLLLAALFAAISSASAELLMLDRFDCTPGMHPDPTSGLYRQLAPLTSPENQIMTGGCMIGFTQEWPWSGQSRLPRVVPVEGAEIEGGRIAFRGNTDDKDRGLFRQFVPQSASQTQFLGVTLETVVIDPAGLALVAFGELSRDSQAMGRAFLEGTGFTQGFAFGFRGNGTDGMNLVMRFRDQDVKPVEQILVEKVKEGVPYRIICRVEWDAVPRGQSPRERVSIWVNPGAGGDGKEPVEFTATSGSPSALTTVYLLQRRYGQDLQDAFFVDDIWLGTEFADNPKDSTAENLQKGH